MLALANVLDLLANEFSRLRRWGFAFARVLSRTVDGFAFWHSDTP
jgi:hypothetical protein